MKNTFAITDLDQLIKQCFGGKVQLLKYKTEPLISKGENYGSEIIALQMEICYNDSVRTLDAVAKMCPPNDYLKETFNTAVTFKKEIAAYNIIFPTLIEFQQRQGLLNIIQFYPDCYAARLNLHSSDIVDDNALILLGNLRKSGYEVVNRMRSFNLTEAELLLQHLAVFHAVPVALKVLQPDVFRSKILPHLARNTIFDKILEDEENMDLDFVIETANTCEECRPYISKVVDAMKIGLHNLQTSTYVCQPFATINHNDFWINNTMLKFENNQPVKNKIIDFQLIDYGSPTNDLLFFLFSSVQMDVVKSHYDYLISLYYHTFINMLKNLKCDVERFRFELFQEELAVCARTRQFYHILIMLRHVFATKEKTKNLCDVTMQDLASNDLVSPECRQRVIDTILYFAKMKWI